MNNSLSPLLLLLCFHYVRVSQALQQTSNPCTSSLTCEECLSADHQCGWCEEKSDFAYSRCDFINRLADHGCHEFVFPSPSFSYVINENISESIGLQPQRVHLKIRPKLRYDIFVQLNPGDNQSEITFKDNSNANVRITCLGTDSQQKNVCTVRKFGDFVGFDVSLEVTSCPLNRSHWNQTLVVHPSGQSFGLLIDLEMICECDCQKSWNQQPKSEYCKRRGSHECGLCVCDDQFYGQQCECDANDVDLSESDRNCFIGNDSKVCSGRGECSCGRCECFKRPAPEQVYGKYCECDNFSCHRYDGLVCGGPSRGQCVCGMCLCKTNWSGPDCSCKLSNVDCVDPKTNKECNGRGKCVCGVCLCGSDGEDQYTGQFCEDCPTCKSQCEQYKACVQCRIHQSGPLDEEACNQCIINPIGTSEFDVQEGEQLCVFIDDDDCKFQFKYKYDEKEDLIYVIAENTKDCPFLSSELSPVLKNVPIMSVVILVLIVVVVSSVTYYVRRPTTGTAGRSRTTGTSNSIPLNDI